MATEAQLVDALARADAAGDTAGAQQLAGMIKQMRGGSASPAETPEQRASTAGQSAGAQEGPVMAAIRSAAHTGTFGLNDFVNAGARYVGQHVTGVSNPDDFSTDLAYTRGVNEGAANEHPVASAVGDISGVVLGGGALSAGARAAESLPVLGNAVKVVGRVLAPRGGQPVRNVARMAAGGGAASGAQSALSGDSPAQVGVNTAVGTVLGPATSYVAQGIAKVIAPLPIKTARLLADKLGLSADQLSQAWSDFGTRAGRPPRLAELPDLAQAAKIKALATENPTVGHALMDAQDAAASDRSQQMAQRFSQDSSGRPVMSSGDLEAWTRQAGDKEFGAVRNQTFPLTPEDNDWVMGEVMPSVSLSRTARRTIANELDQGQLSVNSADIIRRNLRDQAISKPGQGFHEKMLDMNEIVSGAVPEYKAAVANYAKRAQITEGAKLGEGVLSGSDTLGFLSDVNNAGQYQSIGVPRGVQAALYNQAQTPEGATRLAQRLATDSGLHQRLSATLGQSAADKLRSAGQAETTAAERLAQASPRAPVAPQSSSSVTPAAHALGAMAVHSPTGFWYHALQMVKALPGVRMSPAVSQLVARYLTDPKMAQQGINILRKAGAADADLRRLAAGISASAGSATAQAGLVAQ